MNSSRIRSLPLSAAFSLVELLIVMCVMLTLMAFAAPAFVTMAMGNGLTRAGQVVADQFSLARQQAMSRNRDVQVRFFLLNTTQPASYKAIQLWSSSLNDMTVYVPIGPVVTLPENTLISSNSTLSPLIQHATIQAGTATLPGRGAVTYCGFRFRPQGGTDLIFNSPNNFLTVVSTRDQAAEVAPANYYAVQVDPVSGHTRSFRP